MEQMENEKQILSPFVPHPHVVLAQENFPKFIRSMENLVSLLNSYTYYSSSKKVSQVIVKKIKIDEGL